jgi:N utilization substance protein A
VDIKSETEFASEEAAGGYGDEEEELGGRCAAILSTGRRCPNAALPGSRYCGLEAHQALAGVEGDEVAMVTGGAGNGDADAVALAEDAAGDEPTEPEPVAEQPAEEAAPVAAEEPADEITPEPEDEVAEDLAETEATLEEVEGEPTPGDGIPTDVASDAAGEVAAPVAEGEPEEGEPAGQGS